MVGFFIQGVLHLKITLSYLYCAELLENKHKDIAMTMISLYDTGTQALICYYLQAYDYNLVKVNRYFQVFGTIACIIFMFIIPESPRYLFMKDPQSKKAIDILNYIAWFNGSTKRIPYEAVMDNIYQVIQDNNQLNTTTQTTL